MGKKKSGKQEQFSEYGTIHLEGVRTHNLKDIDIDIPKNKITTITGVSGSGKSTLAFDTIYKEGQFRYIESLSSYLRQFFNLGSRPDLDYSSGLSPAVAIEQNKRVGNKRSTVGTLTETDDYLRLMMSKLGEVYCYECGSPLRPKNTEQIVDDIDKKFSGKKVYLIQDIGDFEDGSALTKFVRKNRKQVDQGGGVTRFLVALNYDEDEGTYDDLVEYFYLEDPTVAKESMPVKVFGIFDRVTINESTLNRLKDDVIKMLARADKFGVLVTEGEQETEDASSDADNQPQEHQVVLLHDKGQSPQDIWYPSFGEQVKELGVEYVAPELPGSDDPTIDDRKEIIDELDPDSETVLIGHGYGAVALTRRLEDARPIVRVKKVVLIAPATGEPDEESSDFFTGAYDYEKVKLHCKKLVVYHSQDDEHVSVDEGKTVAEGLAAKTRFPPEKGHFATELGEEFPELIDEVTDAWRERSGTQQRVVVMHGKDATPDDKWYPRLQRELGRREIKVEVPTLPDSEDPNLADRMEALHNLKPDKDTVLIGHSRGGVAILRRLEQVPSPVYVKKIILIGTSLGEREDKSNDFYTGDYNYTKIQQHCGEFVVFHAEDDETIPFEHGQFLADELGARTWFPATGGHFGDKEFSELADEVVTSWEVQVTPGDTEEDITWYTDKYYCPKDDIAYPEFTPQHFSANRQDGSCKKCQGIGEVLQADFEKIIDPQSPYLEAILPWRDSRLGQALLKKLADKYEIDAEQIWKDLPERYQEVVKQGDDELLRIHTGGGKYVSKYYRGIEDLLTDQYQKGVLTVDFQAMLDLQPCPVCEGAKLRQESLHVFLIPGEQKPGDLVHLDDLDEKYNLFDLQSMPVAELLEVMESYKANNHGPEVLVHRITNPLIDRAETISNLGLGYLHTSRKIDSLSGGEIQRLRLAKQLGNKLTGIIYVLDEPTIGLDHREIVKVIEAIKKLKEMGNTIIVVEHNEEFIRASDRVVEVGPGAGDFGGEVLFNGPYEEFLEADTLTAQYLTGQKEVTASFDHTPSSDEVAIKKAHKYNLKHIDVTINLGSFTVITGPSGAGKTTLMYHTLYKFLDDKEKFIQSYIRINLLKEGMDWQDIVQAPIMERKKYEHLQQLAVQEFYNEVAVDTITGYEEIDNVLYVDQTSIGKTPRSCPATFIKVFDDIRKLYAGVTQSKMLSFKPGHFSFNSKKGACPECNGYGEKKVELQFLPDTYVPCTLCKGNRYKPEVLDITRHGKNIADVLQMYVKEALEFFEDMNFIAEKLKLMDDIGLGYLKMGQAAHTLSGGESQRLKLVKHLLKKYRGETVYFLDEPTVGLHPSDIEKLLAVLKKFLDNGDTILMIEHEQNLLKFADKVVRLEDGKIKKSKTN